MAEAMGLLKDNFPFSFAVHEAVAAETATSLLFFRHYAIKF